VVANDGGVGVGYGGSRGGSERGEAKEEKHGAVTSRWHPTWTRGGWRSHDQGVTPRVLSV
jgi:hypothetical protein